MPKNLEEWTMENGFEDPQFDMYRKEPFSKTLKIYGIAFSIVIFGLMPWAIGACMMTKWLFQLIF